jgi:uncharacterized repeat protein (TIGR01451 family)
MIVVSLLVSLLSLPYQSISYPALAQESLSLEQAQQALAQSRGFFTENKGQWDSSILFVGDTDFGKVTFTQEAIYYQLVKAEEQAKDQLDLAAPSYTTQIIQLSFENAGSPVIQGLELLPHYHNYLIGNDPSKWGIECRNFAQVTYTNIWEGIDLAYFFSPEGLKYEYYVHPHARMEDLRIQVEGAELSQGIHALHMQTTLGTLKDDHLLVFGQDTQKTLSAEFSLIENSFSFTGIPEERNETIVIDPLVYSTYLGGSSDDSAYSIAIDATGHAYIVGATYSTGFPMNTTVGGAPAPGYDPTHYGLYNYDAFVVKLNPSGTELLYATFLGGSGWDRAYSIAIDTVGNAYVVGETGSSDFPMSTTVGGAPAPGYDKTHRGLYDAFVVKLNPSGTELLYATFLGGSSWDRADSIVIDATGHAYIVGSTQSTDFPMNTTVGGAPAQGYDQTYRGSYDAFVVKLNPSGTELLYATFLGGSSLDFAYSIAIDATGHAHVVGYTGSSDFPIATTVGGAPAPGYDQTHRGLYDAFVVKLNPSGTELLYATFLGGSTYDFAYSIAIDATGYAYIVGSTQSTDFPISTTVGGAPAPGYDQTFRGISDTFVVKLNPSGTELLYATFLGGSDWDFAYSIAIDNAGHAYIAGSTLSSNFPMAATVGGAPIPGYDQTYRGSWDAFVVKLNPSGTELLYATFLGGSFWDVTYSMTIDTAGNAYVVGQTGSSDFPIAATVGGAPAPGYDQTFRGDYDAFAFKLDLPKPLLELNVSADASSYGKGDLPVLTVDLRNTGIAVASACEVLVTLPPELAFQSSQMIVSTPGPGNSRIFTLGNLPAGGSISFPVFTEVVVNVPAHTSVMVAFDASCLENARASATLQLALIHVLDLAPPHLRIWAEVNKPTFTKGEEALIFVTVVNQGELVASNTRVQMTLPQELSFLRATRYRSVPLTPALIEFELGAIAPQSVQTFQVDVKVLVAVTQLRSIPVHFDVTCTEKSSDFAHVMLQLIPQRSGRPDLYLGLYYRNAQWDPQTASVYIVQDTPLELDLVLTGAQAPYELNIDWGDGETQVLTQQKDLRQTLRHPFKTKGKLKITITVTDQLQRSKTATLHMEVR